ncbi:MAG: class I SAM-dependent methyltransferase, partial [Nonomuraea sp.]|nr:class I SAM-dependent methyltransferase [Nonomuraea sp.]
MNRVMTLGRHAAWCREVAALAQLPPGGALLDVATGSGVIALAAARRYPGAAVHGVDFA